MWRYLLKTMRPKQWVKNVFIFAALVFDLQLFRIQSFLNTAIGAVFFSLVASSVYILNDLADMEKDRQHPVKCKRPLAAGLLSPHAAVIAALSLLAVSFAGAFILNWRFGLLLTFYLGLNLLYSFFLKHIPIIDVLVLASFYVIRVAAGVSLITVQRFSPWLFVCTTLIALFIGLGKRRAELVLLAEDANSHRKVLDGYTIPFLDQLIIIVSGTTIVAYSLYTFSAANLPENHLMMLTIPFVLYGIFRYLYLINVKDEGGAPEEIVLRDWPFIVNMLLWGFTSIAVLYFFT